MKANFCYAIETQNDGAIVELTPCSGHAFSRITYNNQSYLLHEPGLDPDITSGQGHRVLEGLDNIHALKGKLLTSEKQKPAYIFKTHIEIKGRSSELALYLAAHQQDFIANDIDEYPKLCFSTSIDQNKMGRYISNCYNQTTLSKEHVLKSLKSKYKACGDHNCSALFLLKAHAELLAQSIGEKFYTVENYFEVINKTSAPTIVALSGQDLPILFDKILDKPYAEFNQHKHINRKAFNILKSVCLLCMLICSVFIYSYSPLDIFNSQKENKKLKYNLSGEWFLTHKIEKTTHEIFLGLELGYRIFIQQKNNKQITIVGEKWTENGKDIPTTAQTPIHLEGTLEDNILSLHFTEEGTRRKSSGRATWQVIDKDTIKGRFVSTAANASGNCWLKRKITGI
jgi:hypothetical protein